MRHLLPHLPQADARTGRRCDSPLLRQSHAGAGLSLFFVFHQNVTDSEIITCYNALANGKQARHLPPVSDQTSAATVKAAKSRVNLSSSRLRLLDIKFKQGSRMTSLLLYTLYAENNTRP